MSEHDTLPPGDTTRPDHEIPRAPTLPSFADADDRDAALAGAPAWGLAVVAEVRETSSELATAMGEFTGAAGGMLREMREINANQASLRRSFDDSRNEMRSRLSAHDTEMAEIRREIVELREQTQRQLDDLERRAAECEAARGSGG